MASTTKDSTNAPAEKPSKKPKSNSKPKAKSESKPEAKVADKPAPPDRPERLLVLTPGAPLIIDAWITVDGRPHGAAFEDLVKQVVAAADTDKDGRPTWKEFIANKEFLATPLGGGQADAYQGRMWIENHDVNRDGALQLAEAQSWLGRDGGRGASAFSVRSSRAYPPNPRATSRVWEQLDADADGLLTPDEIKSAPHTLLTADADDDLTIAPLELATLREQLQSSGGGMTPIPRDSSRYAVLQLDAETDLDRLQYLLSDLYAPRQSLNAESFPLLPGLFEQLDVDHDGVLDQIDIRRLTKIEPYLELAVNFESKPAEGKSPATLAVRRSAPELEILGPPAADRILALLGATRLVISANDLAPAAAADAPERSQLRAMVHDQCDALFADLDANADGRLGERELDAAPERLLIRDANHDGQLAAEELPVSMVVAFLRSEPVAETAFYVPAAPPPPAVAAETPAWFRAADFNADGDLSRREFLGAAEAFARLDANGDRYIDAAEAAAFKSGR